MDKDARTLVRFRLSAPVVFCWVNAEGTPCHGEGITRDISGLGVFVWSDSCPPFGAEVECEVFLPRVSPGASLVHVRSLGTIARIDPPGVAYHREGFAVRIRDVVLLPFASYSEVSGHEFGPELRQ